MVDYNALEPGMAYWEPTSPIDPEEVRAAIMSRVQNRSSVFHPYMLSGEMHGGSPRLRALINDLRPYGVLASTPDRARVEQAYDLMSMASQARGRNDPKVLSLPDPKLKYAFEDAIDPEAQMRRALASRTRPQFYGR